MNIAKQVPVLPFLQGAAHGTGLYTVKAQFHEQHLEVRPCRCQNSGAAQRPSWSQRPCRRAGDTVFVTSSAFVTHHTVAVTVTRPLFFVLCSRCRIFATSSAFRSSNASCHFSSCLPCSGQLDSSRWLQKRLNTCDSSQRVSSSANKKGGLPLGSPMAHWM